MKKGRAFALPPRARKAAAGLKWPLLGFLLCAGQVAGLYAPFALAAVAIAGIRLAGLTAVLGVAAGAFVFMDFQSFARRKNYCSCGMKRRFPICMQCRWIK